jgi:tetratricopeptide (TPR) repeat protein
VTEVLIFSNQRTVLDELKRSLTQTRRSLPQLGDPFHTTEAILDVARLGSRARHKRPLVLCEPSHSADSSQALSAATRRWRPKATLVLGLETSPKGSEPSARVVDAILRPDGARVALPKSPMLLATKAFDLSLWRRLLEQSSALSAPRLEAGPVSLAEASASRDTALLEALSARPATSNVLVLYGCASANELSVAQQLVATLALALMGKDASPSTGPELGAAALERATELYRQAVKELQSRALEAARDTLDAVLAIDGTYAEAYSNRGVAKAGLGDQRAALADYRSALTYKPDLASAHYNIACALTSLDSSSAPNEDAFAALERALRFGFPDLKQVETDPDLAALRAHPQFSALLERYRRA